MNKLIISEGKQLRSRGSHFGYSLRVLSILRYRLVPLMQLYIQNKFLLLAGGRAELLQMESCSFFLFLSFYYYLLFIFIYLLFIIIPFFLFILFLFLGDPTRFQFRLQHLPSRSMSFLRHVDLSQ